MAMTGAALVLIGGAAHSGGVRARGRQRGWGVVESGGQWRKATTAMAGEGAWLSTSLWG